MPRKKILGPATTAQVLDYFQSRALAEVEVVLEIVTAEVGKRRPKSAVPSTVRTVRTRTRKSSAPEQYGETLGDA